MTKAGQLRASRRRWIVRSINCTAKRRRRVTGSEMWSQEPRISCALTSARYKLSESKRFKKRLRRSTRVTAEGHNTEIARVLVRLDHISSRIVNANHGIG